ncbi:MAG: hypothetical protein ACI36V_02335 [Coriobacteriales bacterium]
MAFKDIIKLRSLRTSLALLAAASLLASGLPASALAAAGEAVRTQEGVELAAPAHGNQPNTLSATARYAATVDGAGYESLAAALRACAGGGTVRVERDCVGGSVAVGEEGVTLDLAGHAVAGLELADSSALSIVSSVKGARLLGTDAGGSTALKLGAGAQAQLDGIALVSGTASRSAQAVELGKGALLSAAGCSFEAASSTESAVCVAARAAAQLRLESCSLKALSSGIDGSVFGVSLEGEGSAFEASRCSFDIDSAAGMAGAVQVAGSIRLADAGIDVQTSSTAALAWGVRALQAGSAAAVSDTKITLRGAAGAGAGCYYCLLDGSGSSAQAQARWSLQGNTLSSCNGTAASFDGSAAGKTVARNSRSGAAYASLQAALASAKTGDNIVLSADISCTSALRFATPVTLDLAGHRLVVRAGKEAAGQAAGGALSFEHSGASTITGGALDIELGSSLETSASSSGGYRGISLGSGASLAIEGTRVSVVYTGRSSFRPSFTLSGVRLSGESSLSLDAGASLSVRAAASDASYGASELRGIDVAGGSPRVSVASGCSVTTRANASTLVKGELNSVHGASISDGSPKAPLMRIFPREGSALDKEIQERFLACAKLDAASDKDGSVHGTGIYYAPAMPLSSGLYVWAFSGPVAREDRGRHSSIHASYVFAEALEELPSSACGVYAAQGSSPQVELDGAINSNATGDARSVQMEGAGSLKAAAASLKAASTGSAYRRNTGGFGLEEIIEGLAGSALRYPADARWERVQLSSPATCMLQLSPSVSSDTPGSAAAAGPAAAREGAASPEQAALRQLQLSVSGLRDSSGAAKAPVTLSTRFGESLSALLGRAGAAASFTSANGTRYRLLGWSLRLANGKRRLITEDAARQLEVGAELCLKDASLDVSACYAAVPAGAQLVRFESGMLLEACTVPSGTSISYAATGNREPAVYPLEPGFSYSFAGWEGGSGRIEPGGSVVASGDCSLKAVFAKTGNSVKLLASAWAKGTNGIVYQVHHRSIPAGEDCAELLGSIAQPGNTIAGGEYAYTFLGWSPRQSDVEPLYTGSCPPINQETSIYGIYGRAERSITVEFYTAEGFFGSARELEAGTMLADAFEATGQERPFDVSPEEFFRGWTAQQGSYNVIPADLTSIGSLGSEDTIKLYAVYGYERAQLSFVDEDGSTPIAQISAIVGKSVSDAALTVVLPPKKQMRFSHWEAEDGSRFSLTSSIVSGPVTIRAVYRSSQETAKPGGGSAAGPVQAGGSGSGKQQAGAAKPEHAGKGAGPAEKGEDGDEEDSAAPGIAAGDPAQPGSQAADGSAASGTPDAQPAGSDASAVMASLAPWLVLGMLGVLVIAAAGSALARRRRDASESLLIDSSPDGREIRF